MRTLILHHHLFKNAGTSVDIALEQAYGARWRAVEGAGRDLTGADLAAVLAADPALLALSSHTFRPPFLVPGEVRILPIILLRHPLDRARSAYEFERKQVADTFGSRLAKQEDFAGYVRVRLDRAGDRAIRNFQTYRLVPPATPPDEELMAALASIARLPFIGLVETYAFSMSVFARLLSGQVGPVSFEVVRANTTAKSDTELDARVAEAEATLGGALAARFAAANRHDQHIFELVRWMHDRMQET
ncbi:hypothetical protein [Falsiroseomonas sp.]|uniref:hypothetical protein n=1 Tax=Falsiroseomonas sp. TaxID=2870721 RepID=UPI0027236641|nr:hypothetical protein [Falsiroseomonas sp.]MDO9502247.1 hypothetical protein [Falsiroseomonas sp.]